VPTATSAASTASSTSHAGALMNATTIEARSITGPRADARAVTRISSPVHDVGQQVRVPDQVRQQQGERTGGDGHRRAVGGGRHVCRPG